MAFRSLAIIVAFAGLWLAKPAAAAITSVTKVDEPTWEDVTVKTDSGGIITWCIIGYPLQRFYNTTAVTSTCAPNEWELEKGWVSGGVAVGNEVTFRVPHLTPSTSYFIDIAQTQILPPATLAVLFPPLSATTLSKLTMTAPTVAGITDNSATVSWATNRNADTRTRYVLNGSNWTNRLATGDYSSVAASGNNLIMAVGNAGVIQRSFDGGITWTGSNIGAATVLNDVGLADPYTAWVVGHSGGSDLLEFSDDGGVTWISKSSGLTNYLTGVAVPNSSTIIAVGAAGKIIKSSDSGASWGLIPQPFVSVPLTEIAAVNDQVYWVGGESGALLKTSDGGGTWVDQSLPGGTVGSISAWDSSHALAATTGGDIWRTNDGLTWVKITSIAPSAIYSVNVVSSTEAWAFGIGGRTIHTTTLTNPLPTWTAPVIIVSRDLSGSVSTSRNNVVVVGIGTVMNYTPDYCGLGICSTDTTQQAAHTASYTPLQCSRSYLTRVTSVDDPNPASVGEQTSSMTSLDVEFTTAVCPDAIPPTVTITTPADNEVVRTSPLTVTGTASDNIAVTDVQVSVNSGAWTNAVGTNLWTFGATLAPWPATNTLNARAHDATPNTSLANPGNEVLNLIYDDQDPTLDITSHANNANVPAAAITLAGTASDNYGLSQIRVKLNAQPEVNASGTTNWSRGLTLANGSNTIVVTAIDLAGRTFPRTITLILDTDDPVLTITSHTNNQCVNSKSVLFQGTATDSSGISSVTVQANGGPIQNAAVVGPNWTIALTLNEGVNVLNVVAQDNAGKQIPLAQTLRIDLNDPEIQITSHTSGDTVSTATPTIQGISNDTPGVPAPGTTGYSCGLGFVEVKVNAAPSSSAAGTSTWTYTLGGVHPTLANGSNTLIATVTDVSGRSHDTGPFTLVLDNNNPVLIITSPLDGATVGTTTVNVTGTAQDNTNVKTVQIQLNGGPLQNVTTSAPLPNPGIFNWNFTVGPLVALPLSNMITVVAKDNVDLADPKTIFVNYQPPDTIAPTLIGVNGAPGSDCPPLPALPSYFITVTWTTSEPGDSVVQYGATNAYELGTITRDQLPGNPLVSFHSVRLQTGINPGTLYYISVTSKDAAGNTSVPTQIQVTSIGVCDNTGPSVSIATPFAPGPVGGEYRGLESVRVSAVDNVQVKDIELFAKRVKDLTGVPVVEPEFSVGPAVVCNVAAPGTCTKNIGWDTKGTPDEHKGTYELTARASDPSGNIGVSAVVSVVTNNDVIAPQIPYSSVIAQAVDNLDGTWKATISWCVDDIGTTAEVDYGAENLNDLSYTYDAPPITGDNCPPPDPATPNGRPSFAPACPGSHPNSHCIQINGLLANQKYHYQVKSCDSTGNCGN